MAGIYIHIPFCKQACHYCNFHFSTSLRYKNELLDALLKEMEMSPAYLSGETIDTIYFGGGTPSLLNLEEIQRLINQAYRFYKISKQPEITFETNPDDITEQKLLDWKLAGINRLSIGIQSFFDEDLQWMNRAHNAKQAYASLEMATRLFNNISIDLIYGTPGLDDTRWEQNVTTALSLGIPHLSCYALTVEPKTPLDKLIREHRSPDINPDEQSNQFLLLMKWLNKAGYEHYEISNFAKPGCRSRHNAAYWQAKKYLGIGPSAHSFNGLSRQWNIANNQQYIAAIQKQVVPFELEVLTPEQRFNEYIMIALRTTEGIDLDFINTLFANQSGQLLIQARAWIDRKLMIQENNALRLTTEGKLLADGIASALFI